ncbi:MAG: diguanylate cyclase [Steroidobacteraceae bacterium]
MEQRSAATDCRLPTIARLRDRLAGSANSPASTWYQDHGEAASFDRVRDMLDQAQRFDAIVIDTNNADQAIEWLRELRAHAEFGHRLLFLTQDLGAEVAALADGLAPPPTRIRTEVDAFNSRCASLAHDEFLEEEERLLAFLYLRPDFQVQPVIDTRDPGYYRYPLLDAFSPSGHDGLAWSDGLRRSRLLEPVKLVDRLRQCVSCASSHLNYVDICTECKSIDIGENIFLHCYTCGNVAPQESFVARAGLTCGRCDAKLKHIGVDYDRALESFSCNACSARFIEPDVEAHCLHCRATSPTTELPERRVHTFRLTDEGRLAARSGSRRQSPATHDTQLNLNSAYFEQTLTWLLQLRQRHNEVQFGVLAVRVTNGEALAQTLSHVRAQQLIDSFGRRLHEVIRATDLVMRAAEGEWFVLSPQTDRSGLNALRKLLESLTVATEQADGQRLAIACSDVAADELLDLGIGARVLLAELQGRAQ